jgi:hypothetical protein
VGIIVKVSIIPEGVLDGEVCSWRDGRNVADDHEGGTVIAVFPTVDGNFRYAVDTEGYGALQFFAEEKLVVHPPSTRTH